jgi:prevent-host-death family protein
MNQQPLSNVRTLTELAKDAKAIVREVRKTKRPVTVTVAGKPGVVILDARSYRQSLHEQRLEAMLLEAEKDIEAGRVRPLEDFVEELALGKKILRSTHRQR